MPKPEKEKNAKFQMTVTIEKKRNGRTKEIIEEVDLGEFPTEEAACDALEDLLEAAGFDEIEDDEKED